MRKHSVTKVFVAVLMLMLVVTSVLTVPTNVEAAVKPTKITLSAAKKTMYVGGKYTLKVKSVTPKKASKSVSFKSSNKRVATVSSKGQIVAKKKGNATITVTSKSNSKAKATCKVTVKQQVKKITVTNSVSNTIAVRIGKTVTLKTKVEPSNASNKKLTYSSSKRSVATVDSKGRVKGKKAGTAKITIRSKDKKAKKVITVKVPAKSKVVKSVSVSPKTKKLKVGGTFTIKPTIKPSKATVKLVSYKSSNAKVATVSSKGKVTAKAVGSATITVTTLDGSKKATCKVTVEPTKVTGITVSPANATLNIGQKVTLKANVSPANATNKKVNWSSSNANVAAVSNGVVTAKAAGTATITATAADGSGKRGTCRITVNKAADPVKPDTPTDQTIAITGVTMNDVEMYANDTAKSVSATVVPANTTMSKTVTYTSSNENYLKVAANGALQVQTQNLAGVKDNKVDVTVTATTSNGKKGTAKVTIILRDTAEVSEAGFYSYQLKNTAECYEIIRNNDTAAIAKDTIGKDIQTLAGYKWNNATLKDNWDEKSFQNLMGMLVLTEDIFPGGYKDNVTATVSGDVMTITGTKGSTTKTVVITRTDNADGTSSLNVEYKEGKTVQFNNITVTDKEGLYEIATEVVVGTEGKVRNMIVHIAKDGTSVKAYRESAADANLIAAVAAADGGYTVKANSTYVTELGLNGSVEGITVMNSYVK